MHLMQASSNTGYECCQIITERANLVKFPLMPIYR